MSLNNPSSLYSGGNVRFDNTPYLRIALNERYKREARGQAIDQYYQKLPESINDKGVRDLEIPIIGNVKNKMMDYWMQNRKAIKEGNPVAQLEMQRLYREAQSVIRESQNAAKIDMNLGRIALDKGNQDLLNTDEFLQRHTQHNLPVTDPNYKPLDVTEVMAFRPFNQGNFLKEIKGQFKYSDGTPTVTPHPQDKSLEVVTTNPVLDDATKENMYAYSTYKLHNDKAFERQLAKDFSTPEQIAPLNEVSKKVFGHEIKEPEDIAAAYTASLLPNTAVRQKVAPSIDARNDEWDRRFGKTVEERRRAAALRSQQSDARLAKMMSGQDEVDYPLDLLANDAVTKHELKSADGQSYGTQDRIYKKDVPVGEFDIYNSGATKVRGIKDIETGEEYFLPTKDAKGHIQLVGDQGRIIGAEVARQNVIQKAVPNNKVKQGMFFNKKGKKSTPAAPASNSLNASERKKKS